jgi:hypothetical protein
LTPPQLSVTLTVKILVPTSAEVGVQQKLPVGRGEPALVNTAEGISLL